MQALVPRDESEGAIGDFTPVLYSGLVGAVVLIWELVITFNMEVERIWQRRKSPFTVYWVFVRYLPLLTRLLVLIASHKPHWTLGSCTRLALAIPVLQAACLVLAHASFLLRTYAIYERRKIVLVPPLAILLTEVGLDIYPVARPGAASTVLTSPMCYATLWSRELVVTQLSTVLAFDATVLALLLARCAYWIRQRGSGAIIRLLIRDGIGYFGIVCVSHLTNIMLLFYTDLLTQQAFVIFSIVIPSIMVSRMLLSLRALEPSEEHSYGSHTITLTALHAIFSDIVDEIGHDLDDIPGRHREQTPIPPYTHVA